MSTISKYNVIYDICPLVSPSAIAAGAAESFVVTDVDHLAAVFPSWDVKFIQVDPGRFRASAGCTLITEANACWRFRGGQRLRPGEIKIAFPGEELDEIYDAGSEGLSLEIDEAMLREALAMTSGKDPDEVLP